MSSNHYHVFVWPAAYQACREGLVLPKFVPVVMVMVALVNVAFAQRLQKTVIPKGPY